MDSSTPSSQRGQTFALIGALLQVVSMIGAIATGIWQIHTMNLLRTASLATVGNLLSYCVTAMTLCTIAALGSLVCLCIALVVFRYRAIWFFWFLTTYSWLLLLAFPVGTVAAIFFLIYTLQRRDEFFPSLRLVSA